MASLVVIIVSVILLSTMAIGFGYRYLTETKKADEKYFKEVLSSAVTKRENNHGVNSSEYPRIGYYIKSIDAFKKVVDNYIPILKSNAEMLYERGEWYIVDTQIANKLGVKGSNEYIDTFDPDSDEKVKLALVDYKSGAVYVFDMNGGEMQNIKDDITSGGIDPIDGHTHDWNRSFATCTEDMMCLTCGLVKQTALGHLYDNNDEGYTWMDDEFHYKKHCIRTFPDGTSCGMKGGYERHVTNGGYKFKNENGTWYHALNGGCLLCTPPSVEEIYEPCDVTWRAISKSEHVKQCKVCKHSESFEHELKYAYINELYHEQVCTVCGFVAINFEAHEWGDDNKCTKCGCDRTTSENIMLVDVKLKNKEYPESHYVTNGETIQLIFKANQPISEANVTICGYGDKNIKYTYSADRLECTAEMEVKDNMTIAQNTKVTFEIDCKSRTTGKWLNTKITKTSSADSYLIYDSIAPELEYILKETY